MAGCTIDETADAQGLVPILLSTTVLDDGDLDATRAGVDVQSTQLANGGTVYATFSNCPEQVTKTNATYTSNGDGSLTIDAAANQPYFTFNGTSTTVKAYHGKSSETSGLVQVTNATTSFTVATDQSTHDSDADGDPDDLCYQASDLMFATSNITKTGATATGTLSFNHQLSKIIVTMQTDGTFTDAPVVVTLNNTNTTVGISDGRVPSSPLASNPATISMGSATLTTTATSLAAIIVPQTISAGTTFMTFAVQDMGNITYTLPTGGMTFTAGSVYNYQLTFNVNMTLTVTATLHGPDTGDTTTWQYVPAHWQLISSDDVLDIYENGGGWEHNGSTTGSLQEGGDTSAWQFVPAHWQLISTGSSLSNYTGGGTW